MARAHTYAPPAVAARTPRVRNAVLLLLQILAAVAFLMAGVSKLAGAEPMVALFDAVGIGQWFRYVTGAIEVTGGLLLLVPALAGVGALLLIPVMLGAAFTEAFVIARNPVPPLILLVIVATIAYLRRERTLRLLQR